MGGLLHSFSSGLGKQLLSPQRRPSGRCQGAPAVAEDARLCVRTRAAPARVSACLLPLTGKATHPSLLTVRQSL